MELKIDTSKDSVEDIKKMINFLQHFVNENHESSSVLPEMSDGLFNIFSDDSPNVEPENSFEDQEFEEVEDSEEPEIHILPY